ncbi:RNA polymerase-binding protein RbpA [Janibacter sp. GS2]|uniref:RNA polymerase-binding protein RbpA n=1 Tax=Janibacter sp. GS2 TaxID=3442646 RepID=UPI003EC05A8F
MAGGNAIRGSRIGAGPTGEAERGDAAPRTFVSYWCANGHEMTPSFSRDEGVEVPAEWECKKCGLPAGQDRDNPPSAPTAAVYKTHLAYVKERRSDSEGEAILEERLGELRGRGLIR